MDVPGAEDSSKIQQQLVAGADVSSTDHASTIQARYRSSLPDDRAAWDGEMIERLLALEKPTLKADMVNFVLHDNVSRVLLNCIFSPKMSTSVVYRPPTNPKNETNYFKCSAKNSKSCIILSYRATQFLTGGFGVALSSLPRLEQEALFHFYRVRAAQVLREIFEAIALSPMRVNVHHIRRLWEACVFFARSTTIDFLTGSSDTLGLCIEALLDVAESGAMGLILLDILSLLTRCPAYSTSSMSRHPVSRNTVDSNQENEHSCGHHGLADAVVKYKPFERIISFVCGDDGVHRSATHCAMVAELHSMILSELAQQVC